uniref:Uncharacterized protein n=1 Tax=Anopheles coluzzii TaxID=1518534 RepID=A0A8W7PJV8_ANOCL
MDVHRFSFDHPLACPCYNPLSSGGENSLVRAEKAYGGENRSEQRQQQAADEKSDEIINPPLTFWHFVSFPESSGQKNKQRLRPPQRLLLERFHESGLTLSHPSGALIFE